MSGEERAAAIVEAMWSAKPAAEAPNSFKANQRRQCQEYVAAAIQSATQEATERERELRGLLAQASIYIPNENVLSIKIRGALYPAALREPAPAPPPELCLKLIRYGVRSMATGRPYCRLERGHAGLCPAPAPPAEKAHDRDLAWDHIKTKEERE